jgi:hypothetical protein
MKRAAVVLLSLLMVVGVTAGSRAVTTPERAEAFAAGAPQMSAPGNPRARWDDPPTCFKGRGQWHFDNYGKPNAVIGYYTHVGQYSKRVFVNGRWETRYYWLYWVEIWNIYGGMMPVGWAHKHCGTVR